MLAWIVHLSAPDRRPLHEVIAELGQIADDHGKQFLRDMDDWFNDDETAGRRVLRMWEAACGTPLLDVANREQLERLYNLIRRR